ncbi:MAG: ammonia-forming cytochrome c nitrite reductase subunit c552, partial [Thermodesulfobacteriota bacterium]|nr:ammonia-forming cytochrome c nitrite reductase subunit c552 [Thermodesulfobacteriota bacterium]
MYKKGFLLVLSFSLLSLIVYLSSAHSKKETIPKDEATCYGCHGEIKSLKMGSKHAFLLCSKCHGNLTEHLKDPEKLPLTNLESTLCGKCHPSQYQTYISINLKSKAKVEKSITTSRSPTFDKLMTPHGFTREHDEPRSHIFMLTDHMLVDRAYGGRFQIKSWRDISKAGRLWDILIDTGRELPQTAKAGNTVCFSCKTTDFI